VQPELQKRIGRPVVVENKPGAASQVGTDYVAKAKPDGNTLLVCFDTHAINPIAKKNLPYDTFKDFVGVSLAVRFPLVIAANPSAPGKDLKEFLAAAKQQPGKFSYASTGLGSMNQLVAEDIKRQSGADVLHVPYGGGGPAVTAVLGNTTTLTLLSYAALKSHIAAGKLKALAVTGTKRLVDLPDVPTVAESGVPGFETVAWFGLLAPAGTPQAVIDRVAREVHAIAQMPDVRARIEATGAEAVGGTPQAFARRIHDDVDKWKRVAAAAKIRIE